MVSYDRMAPGAPYWGRSPYGFQSFTARSNTLTYVGVTWGSGDYQPGSSVAGVTARIRVWSGIGTPRSSDVACIGQLADMAAPVVNLFWWSCSCPAKGRNSAALSDQNQMVVKGYNR